MGRKHPLTGNLGWLFLQYSVGMSAPITVSIENKKRKTVTISGSGTCREGVVHGIRQRLRNVLTRTEKVKGSDWRSRQVLLGHAELDGDHLRQPGAAYLWVANKHLTAWHKKEHPKAGQNWKMGSRPYNYPQYVSKNVNITLRRIQDFIHFCDAIIGPITVLLNPGRYEGDWWTTSVEEAKTESGKLRWYGIDNTALSHPALVSLYTGLARQCSLLTRCDLRNEVLGSIDRRELRECLTQSDPELALRLAKKMKRWIEVPIMTRGRATNLPVPMGSFLKIPALHKAIYKHGFSKTFGRNFEESWALVMGNNAGSGPNPVMYNGIHSFMGQKASNPQGKRILALANKRKQ